MEQNRQSDEQLLLEIIAAMSNMARMESSIYADYSQQIRQLIADAVEKINNQFLTTLDTDTNNFKLEKEHASNLLILLNRALDISKLLNTKINGVMHAIQIEDIAGQILDEARHRIDLNLQAIERIEELLDSLSQANADEKTAILLAMKGEVNSVLNRKKRNHVNQIDLNEGSTELF